MLSQYEENLQNETIEKNRLSENYEDKIQKLTMVSKDLVQNDWMTCWLMDRQTDGLTDQLMDIWMTDWLMDRQMADWPINAYQWDVGYYWSFAVLVNSWKCSFPASSRPQQCIGVTKGKKATVQRNKILTVHWLLGLARKLLWLWSWLVQLLDTKKSFYMNLSSPPSLRQNNRDREREDCSLAATHSEVSICMTDYTYYFVT